jgi:hypothetical protein
VQTDAAAAGGALRAGWAILRSKGWAVLGVSALVVVPCIWHRHIEAGDLGSHVYNAWLAQLVEKGLAPGLYIATQFSNVLFDLMLLHAGNWLGFAAAEKIVVALSVMVFFWGVFALAAAVSGRSPWVLTPCFAMLAYGYSFQMGFFNYYLSIGLGCFCLALAWQLEWQGRARDWVVVAVVAGLAYVAHPLGFLWTSATIGYLVARKWLRGWWRLALPVVVILGFVGLRWFLHRWVTSRVDWYSGLALWQLNGGDQLNVYGDRYETLTLVAAVFGLFCVVVTLAFQRGGDGGLTQSVWWKAMALPAELYLVAFVVTATLPENLRVSLYAAWVGLLVSRLTVISAVLGLCVLASARFRGWTAIGFGGLAAVYFVFLFQDTAAVNRLEANAERLVASLPVGTRVVPTIAADPDWRAEFIGHAAERACVERCFVYSNYEPSSGQFRVRVVRKGSWMVEASAENAEDMQGGGYDIDAGDLPLKHLYQCDREDWTKLCLADLAEGESTGKGWVRPGE